MVVCKKVLYSGHVQGVGFRYTTQRLAQGYAVTGYVCNLPSGQVELVAEGSTDEVAAFIDAVNRQMAEYVGRHTIQDETPQGFNGFTIRH